MFHPESAVKSGYQKISVIRPPLQPSSSPFLRPGRGSLIIAQGKTAEVAALGKTPRHPTSFFPSGLARQWRAKPEGKKEEIICGRNPGRRSFLACPGLLS